MRSLVERRRNFMVLEKMTGDEALAALSQFAGTVLKTSLSEANQEEIQEALHRGQPAAS
jgi:uncharacterized membrane protein